MAKAFAAGAARLAVRGDNPMLLASQDPAKVARANKANSMAYRPALEKITGFDINWNIVAYPNPAWAKQVFPTDAEEIAVAKLAEAIFTASRVDDGDPIAAWREHNATLRKRTAWLNGHAFHALHFTGTDLMLAWRTATNGTAARRPPRTASPAIPISRLKRFSRRRMHAASTAL
jgi:aminopeptidase